MSSLWNATSEFCMMPSRLIVPGRIAERATQPKPTGIGLFSGAGGFSLGMIRQSITTAASNDPGLFSRSPQINEKDNGTHWHSALQELG